MPGQRLSAVAERGYNLAAYPSRLFGIPGKVGCTLKDLCPCLGQRLAFFKSKQPGQVFKVGMYGLFPSVQIGSALLRAFGLPDLKRRMRGLHGMPGLGLAAVGHMAEQLAVGRIGDFYNAFIRRIAPQPVDQAVGTKEAFILQYPVHVNPRCGAGGGQKSCLPSIQ